MIRHQELQCNLHNSWSVHTCWFLGLHAWVHLLHDRLCLAGHDQRHVVYLVRQHKVLLLPLVQLDKTQTQNTFVSFYLDIMILFIWWNGIGCFSMQTLTSSHGVTGCFTKRKQQMHSIWQFIDLTYHGQMISQTDHGLGHFTMNKLAPSMEKWYLVLTVDLDQSRKMSAMRVKSSSAEVVGFLSHVERCRSTYLISSG